MKQNEIQQLIETRKVGCDLFLTRAVLQQRGLYDSVFAATPMLVHNDIIRRESDLSLFCIEHPYLTDDGQCGVLKQLTFKSENEVSQTDSMYLEGITIDGVIYSNSDAYNKYQSLLIEKTGCR